MPKPAKILLSTILVLIGLAVVVPFALYLFIDINAYKAEIETAISDATGLKLSIGGKLHLSYSPALSVSLQDVQVSNHGAKLAQADRVEVGLDWPPLLEGSVHVNSIALKQATFDIERDQKGVFNFENPEGKSDILPAVQLSVVSLSDGTLNYVDKLTGVKFELAGCDAKVRDALLHTGARKDWLEHLTISTRLTCARVRSTDFVATNLVSPFTANGGVIEAQPITLDAFGGRGSGSFKADRSTEPPHYGLKYTIKDIDVGDFLKSIGSKKTASGKLDFVTQLSMQGKGPAQIKRSVDGSLSLHSQDLVVNGTDLDKTFANYRSSQHFDLLDAGAFLFAGPFGVAVTKGYDFATISQDTQGRTRIRKLVADWHIVNGMVRAQDVALATEKNRIAVKGTLDLANDRIEGMDVALINHRGCAVVEQKVHGTFEKPIVDQPNVLQSLAGPVVKLINKVRKLLPHDNCEAFYTGSVAAPEKNDDEK